MTIEFNFKVLILLTVTIILNVNSTISKAQNTTSTTLTEQNFYLAVKQNNVGVVRVGLKSGFESHTLDSTPPNNSALHWAAWESAADAMTELLKQANIQVDVLNSVNETPLMIAALKGNSTMMRLLLAAGHTQTRKVGRHCITLH